MTDSQEMQDLMQLQQMSEVENFHKRSIVEELELSNMIELLDNAPGIGWSASARRMIAEHLVANGVKIPVYCKDCKHRKRPLFAGCGDAYCDKHHWHVEFDDFCSDGARRDNNA